MTWINGRTNDVSLLCNVMPRTSFHVTSGPLTTLDCIWQRRYRFAELYQVVFTTKRCQILQTTADILNDLVRLCFTTHVRAE